MRLRSREIRPLRYYLYVSDTKLDMLFDQMDQKLRKRISAEVKVDLKIASLTLREAADPGPTRMAKLRIIERFIDEHHHVGDFSKPGTEYFRGQMGMRWGRVEHTPAVCFVARESLGTRGLILAGSMRHVLSEAPFVGDNSGYSGSQMWNIVEIFEKLSTGAMVRDLPSKHQARKRDSNVYEAWHYLQGTSLAGRLRAHNPFTASKEHLDFLAVPLAEFNSRLPRILVGTPLYVARAREPGTGTDIRS